MTTRLPPRLRPPVHLRAGLGPLAAAVLFLPACPSSDDAAPDAQVTPLADAAVASPTPDGDAAPPTDAAVPTAGATGLISIQDQQIHGAPAAGHGLSVRAELTAPPRAPDFDEQPGELTGCKAWLYDVDDDPRPAPLDQGAISVAGTSAPVPAGCVFDGAADYICPVTTGRGAATVTPMTAPTALYAIAGAALTDDDVGRHLHVAGDGDHPANGGRFAILAVPAPDSALVVNPAATGAAFSAEYTVLAGAGAAGIPLDSPADPVRDGDQVVVGIAPGGAMDIDFPDTPPIDAGDSFELDAASDALIGAIPVDGRAFSLGCGGEGGRCGEAFASIIQLETTDADLTGASPFAMPPAIDRTVVIQCASPGEGGRIEVPAGATDLLRRAGQDSPITRVRVAFMRDGFALATTPPPRPPSPVRIVAGHQVVAFTTVPAPLP